MSRHKCSKSCSRGGCNDCSNSNGVIAPGSPLFNVDSVGEDAIQSLPRAIISGGLLRFTSGTVTITTSNGPPGTSIVNLETESLVIGPTGPTGDPGPRGPKGPKGPSGPTGTALQVGAAVEWFSGQYFANFVPAFNAPISSFGFLAHDGSIQIFTSILDPITTSTNVLTLLTPKVFTGSVTKFQITLQAFISFNPNLSAESDTNTINIDLLYYPYISSASTYGPPTSIGTIQLNLLSQFFVVQTFYDAINTTPTNINPGDALGVSLTDATPGVLLFTTIITSYYAVAS